MNTYGDVGGSDNRILGMVLGMLYLDANGGGELPWFLPENGGLVVMN